MKFEPLYYKEKLISVNGAGDVGVVTLWSPPEQIRKKFFLAGIDLSQDQSRIAVFGSLYGNGLPQLLRNLLYNPQIRYLVMVGRNRFQSREMLHGFFTDHVRKIEVNGITKLHIMETQKIIDATVSCHDFAGRLRLVDLGELHAAGGYTHLVDFFHNLPASERCTLPRRQEPIPTTVMSWFPSEPRGHTIIRETPVEAWQELIFCLFRFGREVVFKKGLRRELQHVKVVIQNPVVDSAERLAKLGFSLEQIRSYQQEILNPVITDDEVYTYGNRLRAYFQVKGQPLDTLDLCVQLLQADPESRHAYVSLWDDGRDLQPGVKGHPCMVSVFFRRFEEKLTLSATFRSHNGLDGWLNNVYGLMAIQDYVASRVHMPIGAITIISHSMTIDPEGGGAGRACEIAQAKLHGDDGHASSLVMDPNGHFVVSIDPEAQEIVVQHRMDNGEMLTEYRGRTAMSLEKQLVRDNAISLISHALYLGRELTHHELQLNKSLGKS